MKSFKLSFLFLALLGMFTITSCGDDDPVVGTTDDPIASFQFEISETNYLEVTFSNFSQNATSQTWDFGDNNTSTEESPTHTYTTAGNYTVNLTATNSAGEKTTSKTITITDPNSATRGLTGETSKVWKLSRNIIDEEFPIIVGPVDRSQIWWGLGFADPIGTRPCLMEEEYIFSVDGTYTYNSKGEVYADDNWNVDARSQCVDDTDAAIMTGPAGEDLLPWGGGTFTFNYDVANGTLEVIGLGAHIGLSKVATTSEVTTPQASVKYKVISLETDGPVDKLILETDLIAAGGYWQYALVSYDNPADEPELEGAAPTVGFTSEVSDRTVTFTNSSANADSYLWDFGDSNMSTEENPTHTYSDDGSYSVVLSATNANGTSTASNNVLISTGAGFTVSDLHGDGMKTWKLKPIASALAVGDVKGTSSNGWNSTEEDVTGRACTFDDTYEFTNTGAFNYNTNGDLWGEPYMGVDPAGCIMESALSSDAAAWGSGNHTFTVEEATADSPAYLTVTGTGAFIALPKAYNGGEYASAPPTTDGSVRYEVVDYIKGADSETLIVALDISDGQTGGFWWTFTLESK